VRVVGRDNDDVVEVERPCDPVMIGPRSANQLIDKFGKALLPSYMPLGSSQTAIEHA
jgi:hypothetical protein